MSLLRLHTYCSPRSPSPVTMPTCTRRSRPAAARRAPCSRRSSRRGSRRSAPSAWQASRPISPRAWSSATSGAGSARRPTAPRRRCRGALALLVRERLTGQAPPAKARTSSIYGALDRGPRGTVLDRMPRTAVQPGGLRPARPRPARRPQPCRPARAGDENAEDNESEPSPPPIRGDDAEGRAARRAGRRARAEQDAISEEAARRPRRTARADRLDRETDDLRGPRRAEPRRPPTCRCSITPKPSATRSSPRAYDEIVSAEELCDAEELDAVARLSRQAAAQSARRRGAARQPPAAPSAGAAEPRLGIRSRGGHARRRRGSPA